MKKLDWMVGDIHTFWSIFFDIFLLSLTLKSIGLNTFCSFFLILKGKRVVKEGQRYFCANMPLFFFERRSNPQNFVFSRWSLHSRLKCCAFYIKMASWFGSTSKADPADAVEMESRGEASSVDEGVLDESAQKLLPDMTEEEIELMKVEKAKNARRQQVCFHLLCRWNAWKSTRKFVFWNFIFLNFLALYCWISVNMCGVNGN